MLSVCVLFGSLSPELNPLPIPDGVQHQMRDIDAVVSSCSTTTPCRQQASGRLTVQKASGTRRAPRKHLEGTGGPLLRRKPLRHRTLQLSNSTLGNRPSEELLEFPFSVGQDTRPSSERLEIPCSHPTAAPIWSNRRNRGTVYAFAIAEGRMLIAGVAMNGNKERPSLLRWPSSVARKCHTLEEILISRAARAWSHRQSIWKALAAPLPRGKPLPYFAAIQFYARKPTL